MTSRVHLHDGSFDWSGVAVTSYRPGANRRVLAEAKGFQVRYFEVEPGGATALEQHQHEHCVVVMRGRGQAVLGTQVHEIGFGDVVYVGPDDPHQFRNEGATEPFGFLCIVDAERDRPRPL